MFYKIDPLNKNTTKVGNVFLSSLYIFVVYARNARTHKSGPREAQMLCKQPLRTLILVTTLDLKIKLHYFYTKMLEVFYNISK